MKFEPIKRVNGELNLPGDKSISHRAVLFSALAEGVSEIYNLSDGEDVNSTINCIVQLGAGVEIRKNSIRISGKGFNGLSKPEKDLYACNSGTTARLLSGILAAQKFDSVITGDESLSTRPMKRVALPLAEMGGKINLSPSGTLPMRIYPAINISSIKYELPVASAQVKSAIILAGIHSEEETEIVEPIASRNHTEIMLSLPIEDKGRGKRIRCSRKNYPVSRSYRIPSDISTAMYFIVLALLTEGSELLLKNITLNETRRGGIDVLREMGGDIEIVSMGNSAGEIYGDLLVRSSRLKNINIDRKLAGIIIDEIPILSVAGMFAEGIFKIEGVEELRAKESDRIKSLCYNFGGLGVDIDESDDGFSIGGFPSKKSGEFESFGDHRIAMSFAVLSFLLEEGGKINNFGSVNISNPQFINQLKMIVR
jgi:3-phosphoshikimate 1-carboxyvinyltransferase